MSTPIRETWRPPRTLRIASGLLAFFFIGFTVVAVREGLVAGRWTEDIFGEVWSGWTLLSIPFFLGPAILLWRYGVTPYVEERDDGLYVRNPFRQSMIPWERIEGCEPGYFGLTIHMRGGEPIVAVAVQKSNFAAWLKRSTRADALCERVEKRIKGLAA